MINDSIYGNYPEPVALRDLIRTPIVQRLRWVALSNIPSLSYPMISGVSRYAHSLGVSYLGQRLSTILGLDNDDCTTLACAGLLHDSGMPPLGHLAEEAMSSIGISYDHEQSLKAVLLDKGLRFSVLPDGQKIGVTEAILRLHGNSSNIFDTIMGAGPLGKYVASDIDIDNIDNIARLYRLMFQGNHGYDPLEVVQSCLGGTADASAQKMRWTNTRKELYTKLMFSISDFAQKATLKRLIKAYFNFRLAKSDQDEVVDSIRFLNDAQFMSQISETLSRHQMRFDFYSGKFDSVAQYGWIDSADTGDLSHAIDVVSAIHPDYYFDYIPDKREKFLAPNKNRGALIGAFSSSTRSKSIDAAVATALADVFPSLRLNYTPNIDAEMDQLSII